jgi:hypothetical protein
VGRPVENIQLDLELEYRVPAVGPIQANVDFEAERRTLLYTAGRQPPGRTRL